jgi:hypothetical protein
VGSSNGPAAAQFKEVKVSEQDKIDRMIENAEAHLEGENRHSAMYIPEAVWYAVEKYVPPEEKLAACKAMCRAIVG